MLDNHTGLQIFNLFSDKYSKSIFNQYPHLNSFHIHCFTLTEYLATPNLPVLNNFQNTPFITICDDSHIDKDGKLFAAIIIYNELCELLQLSEDEIFAALCHEIGHIVHYGNTTIKEGWYKESCCDEVAIQVGLAKELASVLQKILNSYLYKYVPNKDVEFRIKVLNRY